MITKECRKCNEEKKAKDFPKGRDANGLYYICKTCTVARSQRLRASKDPLTRWVNTSFHDSKSRAKKNNIQFTLSKEYMRMLYEKQNHTCKYCDDVFNMDGSTGDIRKSPSIDRVQPTGGYTPDNIVLACRRCNTIKNDATLPELIKMVGVLTEIYHND